LGLGTAVTSAAAQPSALRGKCTISFSGTSTLHGFEGTAACEPFTLEPVDAGAAKSSQWKTHVRVDVTKMSTDNKARDRNMAKMFDAETYPWIEASFESIQPGPSDTLEFRLTIGKSTNTVVAKITERQEADDELSFSATFKLSLADYALKPPSVFGIIRVGDEVSVRVNASVRRDH